MLEQTEPDLDRHGLVDESEDFTVDPRVYTSASILDAEMRRITAAP